MEQSKDNNFFTPSIKTELLRLGLNDLYTLLLDFQNEIDILHSRVKKLEGKS